MTYPPLDDSEFLSRYVRDFSRGHVLDMGTGSGIQAITALKNPNVTYVTAVDIDEDAVLELPVRDKLTVMYSNLFSKLEGKQFDTIVCNPPYLPDEEKDEDPTIYGGPKGYEYIEKFLSQAKEYLTKDGQILLLFSSLTNKVRVDQIIKLNKYNAKQLGELAMFFERLYVYRLTC